MTPALSLLAVGLCCSWAVAAGAEAPQYIQDDFVLSGYLDPPLNDASYAALAGANFTGVFGDRTCVYAGSDAKLCSRNGALQAQLCAKYKLSTCFPGFSSAASVPLNGSVKGYYLRDEPHAKDFRGLAETVADVHKHRPGSLVFVNLLGGYMASPAAALAWWGFPRYEQYVDAFVSIVRPDILCFDLYPSFGDCGWGVEGGDVNASADTRGRYLDNLAFINNRSLAANVSFWNYFDNQAQGASCGPTKGKVAWQMFAAALHGSRGLLHFLITPCKSPKNCGYYPPPAPPQSYLELSAIDEEEPSAFPIVRQHPGHLGTALSRPDPGCASDTGCVLVAMATVCNIAATDAVLVDPSILTPEGVKPMAGFPPYDNAADLNSRFKALGPYLMRMRTCSELLYAGSNCTMGNCASRCQVYLRANDTDPSRKLRASGASVMLSNISKGDYNIALFQPERGIAMEAWAKSSENDDTNRAANILAQASQVLMLQNHDAANFRFTTVKWGSTGPPLEVDQYSGRVHVAKDAAPHVGGFQVMLGAGEARMYVFTK